MLTLVLAAVRAPVDPGHRGDAPSPTMLIADLAALATSHPEALAEFVALTTHPEPQRAALDRRPRLESSRSGACQVPMSMAAPRRPG